MATVAEQLAALGYDPSYGGRSSLYSQWGLGGGFRGTASQNIALLNAANQRGRNNGGGGGAPGAPVDNRTELQRFTADTSRQRDERINSQNAMQQGYFDRYRNTLGGQEKLGSAYDRLNTEAGIPELKSQLGIFKGQIYQVKDLLDRLNEDINSRVSGTFTTGAQARRIEAAEGSQLNNQLGRLGTGMAPLQEALMGAQQDVSNRLGFLQADQSRELKPLEMEIGSLSDRFAREITGFNQNAEGELTALMDKITRERELSDREWQRASALALQEQQFQAQREAAAAAMAASKSAQGQSSLSAIQGGDLSALKGLGSTTKQVQFLKSLGMSNQEISNTMNSPAMGIIEQPNAIGAWANNPAAFGSPAGFSRLGSMIGGGLRSFSDWWRPSRGR